MKDSTEYKSGINWDYLNTLLKLQENLLIDYQNMVLAMQGIGSKQNNYKMLCKSMTGFYLANIALFDEYQEKSEFNIKYNYLTSVFNDYSDNNLDKLLKMCIRLIKWAQKAGPFKTVNQSYSPHSAFQR